MGQSPRLLRPQSSAAAAAFDPSSVTSATKLFWLKAGAGLFKDTGGSTPATADGDAVALWKDQFNSNDAIQPTSAARPVLKLGVVNGQPVVRCDGVQTFLSNSLFAGLNNQTAYSLFLAAKATNSNTNQFAFVCDASGGTRKSGVQILSGVLLHYAGTDASTHGDATADTSWFLTEDLYDGSQTGNSNRLKVWHNGTQSTLAFTGTVPASLVSSSLGFSVGGLGDGSRPLGGDIAEIVLYQGVVSSQDQTSLRSYFDTKYALGF